MDTEGIRRQIGRCTDAASLGDIIAKCRQRRKVLAERAAVKAAEEAWERVKHLQHGDTVYCCALGVFLGGTIQRGDALRVVGVQPQAKLLWLDVDGKRWWFEPAGIARYDFQTQPPEDPCSKLDRAMAKRVGKLIGG